jgi:RNA polymerase sigma factor (sigma-70 family)
LISWVAMINAEHIMKLGKYPRYSKKKLLEKLYKARFLNSHKDREEVIESFIPMVFSIAKKFKYGNSDDHLQNGFMGLVKAIDRCNINSEEYFVSYIYQNIVREIVRGEDHGMIVKQPRPIKTLCRRIEKYKSRGIEDPNELLKLINSEYEKQYELSEILFALPFIEYRATEYQPNYDTYTPGPANKLMNQIDADGFLKDLEKEYPRESNILKRIFIDQESESEIGRDLNLSRERIRQIKERAFRLIRKRWSIKNVINKY